MKRLVSVTLLFFGLAIFSHADETEKDKARQWLQQQPVKFLENKGQMMDMNGKPVPFVLFKAHAPGVNMYITETGLTYLFQKMEEEENEQENREEENHIINWERVDMFLKNASIKKENIIKEGAGNTDFNFFYPHCSDGIYGVKEYEKIIIKNVYPNIDWVFYNSSSKGFKYDFIVHPGGDPNQVQLVYSSENKIKLTTNGLLRIKTSYGELTELAPESFLNNKPVESKYKHLSTEKNDKGGYDVTISFAFESLSFEPGVLRIDPTLFWATFYGGDGFDGTMTIDTDESNNVFIAGYLGSSDFPVLDPGGGAYYQGTQINGGDVFIVKFTNSGVRLWATYYGGSSSERINSLICDGSGNVYVAGSTASSNFPVFNPGGGVYFQGTYAGGDAFLVKFSNAGVRLWATLFGGSTDDQVYSLAYDCSGNVFMAGTTQSTNLPVVNPGGGAYFQGTYGGGSFDAFIVKFSNAGILLWATYYGGNGNEYAYSLALDGSTNVFMAGYTASTNFPVLDPGGGAYFQATNAGGTSDAFIVKFSNAEALLWSTYYGGSGEDIAYSLACEGSSEVFMAGSTRSTNFPLLDPGGGAFFQGTYGSIRDAFIVNFSNVGIQLWATYYGGSKEEYGPNFPTYNNLVVDGCGTVYLTFDTESSNMFTQAPCDGGYFDNTFAGSPYNDLFLARFSNTGVLLWATYIGGNGDDYRGPMAMDNAQNLFLSGEWTKPTGTSTYPLTNPGGGAFYQTTFEGFDDCFMMRFNCSDLTPCGIACNTCNVLNATATQTNIVCSGQCTGTAVTIPTGGTDPYTYLWNTTPVQTTQAATNLCPGNYSVTVTDAVNNTSTTCLLITQLAALTADISSQVNVTCTGGNNGSATVEGSGGTPGFTYLWNTSPPQTSATATGLSAGNYIVTVTDGNGCDVMQTVTIAQPPAITASISSQVNVACNSGNNGSATAEGSGGTPGYTYLWNTSPAQTSATATGLSAGNYMVTVTDANGCGTTQMVIITEPDLLTASASSTPDTCGADNGTATASVTGGTPPYFYLWNNGQTTLSATGLSSGNFSVTVTDAGNCTGMANATVSSTEAIMLTASATSTTCGNNNGSVSTSITAGIGPFTYLWSPGGATTAMVSNLASGTYTVTVTGTGGCTGIATATIAPSTELILTTSASAANCNQNNGSAIVDVTGGSGNYTYSWSPGGATTASINNLAPNNYTVTVNDGQGCTNTATVLVPQNTSLTASATVTDVSCLNNDGAIILTPSGGTPAYSYSWSPGGGTTQNLSSLTAGDYTVIISDNTGCEFIATYTVNSTDTMNITSVIQDETCKGYHDGSIDLTVDNGTGSYSYSWSPNGATTQDINGLMGGDYSVIVSDLGTGCNSTQTFHVTDGYNFPLTIIQSGDTLTASTAPNYQWYFNDTLIPGAINQTYIIQQGGYYYCLTDSQNCLFSSNTIEATCICVNGVKENSFFSGISVFPNPATDELNVIVTLNSFENVSATLIDITGRRLWLKNEQKKDNQFSWKIPLFDIAAGSYFVQIYAGSQSKNVKVAIMKE